MSWAKAPVRPTLTSRGDHHLDLGADLIQPATRENADVEVLFGTTATSSDQARLRLRVFGDYWSARLERADKASAVGRWAGRPPFGPLLGAVAVAAEVARLAAANLAATLGLPVPTSQPVSGFQPLAVALPPLPNLPTQAIDPAIDFVSAGAITHAGLFVLARVPTLGGSMRVVDDDLSSSGSPESKARRRSMHRLLVLPCAESANFLSRRSHGLVKA